MPNHLSTASDDDRVISIRTRQKYQPAPRLHDDRIEPADIDRYVQSAEPDDFRHRMMVNGIAFLFVAILVVAGVWLADTITTMRKNQDCVLSGKRNCSPVETSSSVR